MKLEKETFKKIGIIAITIIIIAIAIKTTDKEKNEYENIIVEQTEKNELEKEENENEEKIKIYITGAINYQGVYELNYGARIEDAIIAAGGITQEAEISEINMAYCLEDGQKIRIPKKGENQEYILEGSGENIIEEEKQKNSKININKATTEELCQLTGVGEALAQKIINYREENGKFKKIEDLKNVSGIGEKKYESLKDYITIK